MESILFSKHDEFTANLNPELPYVVQCETANVPHIFKKYHYPVSSWPVLVEKEMAKEVRHLSVRIPKLLAQIPELYFENDVQKVADFYFGGDTMMAEFTLMCQEKNMIAACRLDVSYTDDGFKVLEANMGSSIGGWQVQSFEDEIRSYHTPLHNEMKHHYYSEDTQVNSVEFITEEIFKSVSGIDKEINLFLSVDKDDNMAIADTVDFFQEMVNDIHKDKDFHINVYSCNNDQLRLQGPILYHNDTRVHGILDMNKQEMPAIVFRAYLLGTTYFQDNLITHLHSDKRNLALLRFLAEEGKFSEADNRLLKKCLPWTVEFKSKTVDFKGEQRTVTDLIKNKDNFVIKPFGGMQGEGVSVGKFLTQERWEEVIAETLDSGEFILQEFCDSKQYLAPNRNNEWTPHKLIWGMFSFGKMYGGLWVRMSEVANDVGVINSSMGAIEAITYEIK
jgi:hypothetical protein